MNERVLILRESVVKITQLLSGMGIRVTQSGVNAYVRQDPRTGKPCHVNLPYLPDNASDELCSAIQGFLDHEVAHILFSDFAILAEADKRDCEDILRLLEDARIEKAMAKRFTGSAHNLSVTGQFFLKNFTDPELEKALGVGDGKKAIGLLMVPLIRSMCGQQVWAEYMKDKMPMVQSIYDKIKDFAPRMEALSSSEETLELADEITKRLKEGKPKGDKGKDKGEEKGKGESGEKSKMKKEKPKTEKGESKGKGKDDKEEKSKSKKESGGKGEKEKSEEEGEGEKGKNEGKSEKSKKSEKEEKERDEGKSEEEPESEPESKEDDEEEGEGEDEGEEEGEGEDEGEEEGEGEDEEEGGVAGESDPSNEEEHDISDAAPNWDEIEKELANGYDEGLSRIISDQTVDAAKAAPYLIYSKDGDKVEPLHVGNKFDSRMLVHLQEQVEHMVAPLQKDLERAIAARSLAVRSHGHRSGRLHGASLARLAVNDSRVFSRKHESRSKDVAVSLVIDMSGSMSGQKIHLAAQSAYALSSVLERIGIKHEVICFTTGPIFGDPEDLCRAEEKIGRKFSRSEALYMPVIKGFNERLSTEVKNRFGWLPNSGHMANNVDGECVEVAGYRLMARREAGKVMIVLSDGHPACYGDRNGLHLHLKETVKKLEARGVNVVGLGIMSNAVDAFYKKKAIINDVNELPNRVMKELRSLLLN